MNLPSKIWDGKVVAGPNCCHIFTGYTDRYGYGLIKNNGWQRRAHRVIYEECWGPIPEGMMVLHKCNVRNCVNPLHLYTGTQKENMRDRKDSGYRHSEETITNISKAKLAKRSTALSPQAQDRLDKKNARRRKSRGNS